MTVDELLTLFDSEPDDESECLRCNKSYSLKDGLEPTTLCDPCAQDTAIELAVALRAERARADTAYLAGMRRAAELVWCHEDDPLMPRRSLQQIYRTIGAEADRFERGER